MCCKEKGGCTLNWVVKILLIVGGLNWGLVGAGMLMGGADWNVVKMLLGNWPAVEAVVYVVVGAAAIAKIFGCCCSKCKAACCAEGAPAADVNAGSPKTM